MPVAYTSSDILKDYQNDIVKQFIIALNLYKKSMGHWNHLRLNEQILFEAIGSCYSDIYRLQVFRNIRHADTHKRAAFLMKWIVKYRPIQIVDNVVIRHVSTMLANEIFAVELALTMMNVKPEKFFNHHEFCNYSNNIVYLLRFHSCEAEQLASELFLLEQHAAKMQL